MTVQQQSQEQGYEAQMQGFSWYRRSFVVPARPYPGNLQREVVAGCTPELAYFGRVGLAALTAATSGDIVTKQALGEQHFLDESVTAGHLLDVGFTKVVQTIQGPEANLAALGTALIAVALAVSRMIKYSQVRPSPFILESGGVILGMEYKLDIPHSGLPENRNHDPIKNQYEDRRLAIAKIMGQPYIRSITAVVGMLAVAGQPPSPGVRLISVTDAQGWLDSEPRHRHPRDSSAQSRMLTISCDHTKHAVAASFKPARLRDGVLLPDMQPAHKTLTRFAHAILFATAQQPA